MENEAGDQNVAESFLWMLKSARMKQEWDSRAGSQNLRERGPRRMEGDRLGDEWVAWDVGHLGRERRF